LSIRENEGKIKHHQGSALKLKHVSPQLTQRLVSLSSPVVPKVWVETQTRTANGQKTGRAEAIQAGVVYIQRYHYLSVCL